ncbi:MAG TPA: hypothetical protein VGM86_18250 [Thermoanaerobaculia bacterium]|jgi:hypothetical protein
MNGNPRRRYLLYALGFVALVALWHYLGPMLGFGGGGETAGPTVQRRSVDAEGDEPSRPGRRVVTTHQGAKPGDRVAVLRMADLERVPGESQAGRDPWRFVDPPPPPPPPPHVPTKEELEAQRRAEEEARRRAEEAARLAAIEAAKPHPPEFNLQYLGRFGPPDRQIAVFTNGKQIFNKQEGEVIDNKFVVAHIGYESVDISFVGFPTVPPKRVGVTPRRPGQGPVGGNPGGNPG